MTDNNSLVPLAAASSLPLEVQAELEELLAPEPNSPGRPTSRTLRTSPTGAMRLPSGPAPPSSRVRR